MAQRRTTRHTLFAGAVPNSPVGVAHEGKTFEDAMDDILVDMRRSIRNCMDQALAETRRAAVHVHRRTLADALVISAEAPSEAGASRSVGVGVGGSSTGDAGTGTISVVVNRDDGSPGGKSGEVGSFAAGSTGLGVDTSTAIATARLGPGFPNTESGTGANNTGASASAAANSLRWKGDSEISDDSDTAFLDDVDTSSIPPVNAASLASQDTMRPGALKGVPPGLLESAGLFPVWERSEGPGPGPGPASASASPTSSSVAARAGGVSSGDGVAASASASAAGPSSPSSAALANNPPPSPQQQATSVLVKLPAVEERNSIDEGKPRRKSDVNGGTPRHSRQSTFSEARRTRRSGTEDMTAAAIFRKGFPWAKSTETLYRTESNLSASEAGESDVKVSKLAGLLMSASHLGIFEYEDNESDSETETCCFSRLAHPSKEKPIRGFRGSLWFDVVIGIAILLNAISIGVSVDMFQDWGGWIVIDSGFALIFTVELVLKYCSSGVFHFFLGPQAGWNVFDLLIVVFAWVEVMLYISTSDTNSSDNDGGAADALTALRIMRLLRIARVVRVCKLSLFAELMMMINGALGGMKTFMWSQLLLAVPLYVVALFLREMLGSEDSQHGAEFFSSLSEAYFTCFRCLVAGECTNGEGKPLFVLIVRYYGWGYALIYCFTTVLMTFGLFNVIVAIYVENTVAAAKYNELRQKQMRLTDQQMFVNKSAHLIKFILRHCRGEDGKKTRPDTLVSDAMSVHITPEIFEDLLAEPRFQQILRDLDIADEEQLDLFDTLDVDGGGTIDLEELIMGITKLRGDARRSDIVSVGLMVRSLQEGLARLERNLEKSNKRTKTFMDLGMVGHMSSAPAKTREIQLPDNMEDYSSDPGNGAGIGRIASPSLSVSHSKETLLSLPAPRQRRSSSRESGMKSAVQQAIAESLRESHRSRNSRNSRQI